MSVSASINPRPGRIVRAGAAGAGVAIVLNSAIFGLGRAADVVFAVDHTTLIHLSDVISLSLFSLALGTIAAAVSMRIGRPSLRSWQIVGGVVAAASTFGDFTIDATVAGKLLLLSMHVVAGVAYVTSLQVAKRGESMPSNMSGVRIDHQPAARLAGENG